MKIPHWLKHRWGPWEDGVRITKTVPIGDGYPPDVRGKEFEAKKQIQLRRCQEPGCGRLQKRSIL